MLQSNTIKTNRNKSFLFLRVKTRSGALERPRAISRRYSAITCKLSIALKLFLCLANTDSYLQESVTIALFPIVTILLHQIWGTKNLTVVKVRRVIKYVGTRYVLCSRYNVDSKLRASEMVLLLSNTFTVYVCTLYRVYNIEDGKVRFPFSCNTFPLCVLFLQWAPN